MAVSMTGNALTCHSQSLRVYTENFIMTCSLLKITAAFAISTCFATAAFAGPKDFHKGTVITQFGEVATVDANMTVPKRTKFKVLFDAGKAAETGSVNRTLNSAARFLNMHAEAGAAEKNMKVAIVFHGKASFDITKAAYYLSLIHI